MRLIDADEVQAELREALRFAQKKDDNIYASLTTLLLDDWVAKFPTIRPIPVGHWKKYRFGNSNRVMCSNCGETACDGEHHDYNDKVKCRYKFCPNCGARMDAYE